MTQQKGTCENKQPSCDAALQTNDLMKYTIMTLVGVVISLLGFWFAAGRFYVTRQDVQDIVEKEMLSLEGKLDIYVSHEQELQRIIEQNTQAIVEFKVQIATLSQTLRYLETQIQQGKTDATTRQSSTYP